MDIATATARIAAIDEILAAGVTRVRKADRVLEYDLELLAKERNRLQAYVAGGQLRVGRRNPAWNG